MSGYQQGHGQAQGHGHNEYDDGYGHQGNSDSYYQDDQQYYDNNNNSNNNGYNQRGGQQQGDGYYDESYVAAPPPSARPHLVQLLLTRLQRLLQRGPQQPVPSGRRLLRQSGPVPGRLLQRRLL